MRNTFVHLAILALALLLLGGCHSRPGLSRLDRGPLYDDMGHAGSLVMPSEAVRSASLALPYEPWYAGRNDQGPSVSVGYQSFAYDRSITYTRDSQYMSGGRVYDRYSQTTYRRTVRESQR